MQHNIKRSHLSSRTPTQVFMVDNIALMLADLSLLLCGTTNSMYNNNFKGLSCLTIVVTTKTTLGGAQFDLERFY